MLRRWSSSNREAGFISACSDRWCPHIPFALGYIALFFCAIASGRGEWLSRILAPIGRMALTSYVTQSIVLGFVFFGYGLGLFGRLPSAPVALGGIALYVFQLGASHLWLSRFRFGPLEWLWRSLTFGSAQPLRRPPAVSDHPASTPFRLE